MDELQGEPPQEEKWGNDEWVIEMPLPPTTPEPFRKDFKDYGYVCWRLGETFRDAWNATGLPDWDGNALIAMEILARMFTDGPLAALEQLNDWAIRHTAGERAGRKYQRMLYLRRDPNLWMEPHWRTARKIADQEAWQAKLREANGRVADFLEEIRTAEFITEGAK